MTFPAASSRRLERTPGVRDAIECRRGKVASLGEKEEEECVGNLKRDVSGSVEILSVTMAGNRQFCQNAKKDSLSLSWRFGRLQEAFVACRCKARGLIFKIIVFLFVSFEKS